MLYFTLLYFTLLPTTNANKSLCYNNAFSQNLHSAYFCPF